MVNNDIANSNVPVRGIETVPKKTRMTRVSAFKTKYVQKIIEWEDALSDVNKKRIDAVIKKVILEKNLVNEDASFGNLAIEQEILCLEIKQWYLIREITDRIITRATDNELYILVSGYYYKESPKLLYLFRKLKRKFGIRTHNDRLTVDRRNKMLYYAKKKLDEKGIVTKTVILNDLLQKLSGEYRKRAIEKPEEAVQILDDVIKDVERAISFKEENSSHSKVNQNGISSSVDA